MRIWTKHADEVVIRAFQVASWNSVMGPVASQWSDTELQVKLQSIPTPARREDWYRMARRPFTEAEIQFSVSQIRRTVEMMELALEHAPWLAGEAFSLADINMSPYAVRFVEHRPNGILLDDFPKVADWWRRVQERPAFGRARIESTVKASQEAANAAQITT
jgi:glutathione S-transferase